MMQTRPARMNAFVTASRKLALAGALLLAPGARADTLFQDSFVAGLGGWTLTTGAAHSPAAGADGLPGYAALGPGNGTTSAQLAKGLTGALPDGARDFTLELSFRAQDTTQRQFGLILSNSSATNPASASAVNIRHQGGGVGWGAYNGATFVGLPALPVITPGQWYRFRLTARQFGTPAAAYDLALSNPGGGAYTSFANNLTFTQNGQLTTATCRGFSLHSIYGSNPGFDVDEVTVSASLPSFVRVGHTYPHLAVFNGDGECGIGAVMPWADRLWFLTYPPHQPQGSPDKLWSVQTNRVLEANAASVGGTHAGRMIHRESNQLVMGPYFIASNGVVRAANVSQLRARLTAVARHLTDPAHRVYFFGMERELYEVDVDTLAVTPIYGLNQGLMPGTHGKGAYTSQGRLIVSNNGESGWNIAGDPNLNGPAGTLAESDGSNWSTPWTVVERKTFCEITGPGGVYGADPTNDVAWATGWDKRSCLLKLLDGGVWSIFRLPRASFTHDALHGWFTEWPRIREIAPGRRLMHMHGMFLDFPGGFRAGATGGLRPLSTFLMMPVDYCSWNGELVLAKDDASTLQNAFAGQSHSNLWFGQPEDLTELGAPAGFGGPWLQDAVQAGMPSDPFLVAGFTRRALHLRNGSASAVSFEVQVDADGAGSWGPHTNLVVQAGGYAFALLPPGLAAEWARLVPSADATGVTAWFHLGNSPATRRADLFAGLADAGRADGISGGILRARSGDASVLQFAADVFTNGVAQTGFYEIGASLKISAVTNAAAEATLRSTYSLAAPAFSLDAASVIVTEGANRFRLPRTLPAYDASFAGAWPRGRREVVTERHLFQAHGTFYEEPRADSGGFRRIRPVCSHLKRITDFASWRGLLVLAGVPADASQPGRVFRSSDGRAALWFGDLDDLWRAGTPCGVGGPWKDTPVTAGVASDPYLMAGYDEKILELSHTASGTVVFTVEVDVAANNVWSAYASFAVPSGVLFRHAFPPGYGAHWVRLKADQAVNATASFYYTSPALPAPSLQPPLPRGGAATVPSLGAPGGVYILQRSTDLLAWTDLQPVVLGADGRVEALDPNPPADRAYYRLRGP